MKDFERTISYKQLAAIYNRYFSIAKLAGNINEKFALISLICWVVYNIRKKRPDVTYYQIINKLAEGTGLNEEEVDKFAIICEDFGYGCNEFPTFGIEPKHIPAKVKELLGKLMPF